MKKQILRDEVADNNIIMEMCCFILGIKLFNCTMALRGSSFNFFSNFENSLWLKYFENSSVFVWTTRSIYRRCSVRKGVLTNFAKFIAKHRIQSPFLIKLQALGWCVLTLEQRFSCEFYEIFKNTFLQNTSGRLLLDF